MRIIIDFRFQKMTEREKQEMNSGNDSKMEVPPHKMKKLNSGEPTSRNLGQFFFLFLILKNFYPQNKCWI